MSKGEVVPKYKRISKKFIDDHKDEVYKMAVVCCTDKELAYILEISEDCLRNNFLTELARGRAEIRKSLRKAQLSSAIHDKNSTMLIWLGKNYLSQKEPRREHDVEHSGKVLIEKVIFGSDGKENKTT